MHRGQSSQYSTFCVQELTVSELCLTAQPVVDRLSEVGKGDVEVRAAEATSL